MIEEYDTPVVKTVETKDKEFYRQILDVIRGIMSISMKTNEFLKFAVLTGGLGISSNDILAGRINYVCYTVTSRRFHQYFDFTVPPVPESNL